MIKKYLAVLAAFGVAAAAFATGCSNSNETAETTTESQTESKSEEASSETAEVADEVTKIGESIDDTSPNYDLSKAENISETGKVTLANNTGMDIKDISYVGEVVNDDEPLTFTYDNMIMGDVFEKDAEAEMVYPESYHTEDDAETAIEFNSLSLNVTFDSDESAVLHSFEVGEEVEKVTLCYEDEVLYLTYTDKDGNEVNTKEDELAYSDSDTNSEVEVVSEKSQNNAAPANEQEQGNDSNDEVSANSNADDNASVGDTPSVKSTEEEAPKSEEKSNDDGGDNSGNVANDGNDSAGDNGGSADPNGGCLGDEGLFY